MKTSSFLLLALSAFTISFSNISNASECITEDKRVCEYNAQIKDFFKGPNIKLSPNSTSHPSIGAQNEWVIGADDIIHLGDTQDYNNVPLKFLLAHEYAHTILKHTRKHLEEVASPSDRSLSDLELYEKYKDKIADTGNVSAEFHHKQEFEADSLAIKFLESNKEDSLAAIKEVLKNNTSSHSHPNRRERLEKAKEAIEKFRKDNENKSLTIVQNNTPKI